MKTGNGLALVLEFRLTLLLLHRHDQFVHDVIFALRRVLAHVEIEDRAGLGTRRVFHVVVVRQHHFLADELREFLPADFTYAFEPHNLRSVPGSIYLDRLVVEKSENKVSASRFISELNAVGPQTVS